MKRLGSLLTAVVLVLVMGVSAFAAIPGGDDTIMLPEPGDPSGTIGIQPTMNLVTEGTVTWAEGEIIAARVEKTSAGAELVYVIPPSQHLEPATEYSFQLFSADSAQTGFDITQDAASLLTAITTDTLTTNGKLRLRSLKGTGAISAASIRTRGSGTSATYHFDITTKDTYNTRLTDVAYSFYTTGVPADTFVDGGVSFEVGHRIMSDTDIDYYAEGDIVTIMRDAPVFTRQQIDRIARAFNYRAVEFEGEDASWRYTGRISGMSDTNFYYTHDVIPSIMNRYDQDFKFMIFPAGVTFPTNGELYIDVSDVSGDWSRMYTYLYRDGLLTRVNTTYDAVNDEIHFRTNYLGAFVMTDVEITDNTVVQYPNEASAIPNAPESILPTTPPTVNNPNTGAGMPVGLNLVMGLGVVSLLTAGSVIIRKKK